VVLDFSMAKENLMTLLLFSIFKENVRTYYISLITKFGQFEFIFETKALELSGRVL